MSPNKDPLGDWLKFTPEVTKSNLLKEIDVAIAWGSPDKESMGYSSEEFIRLLIKCREYIKDSNPKKRKKS